MKNLSELGKKVDDISWDISSACILLQTILDKNYIERELDNLVKQHRYIGNYQNNYTLLKILSEMLWKNKELLEEMAEEFSNLRRLGGGCL